MKSKIFSKKLTASIIIPYYKTPRIIRENLPKVIKAMKHKPNRIVEIIFVDDASCDEGGKIVRNEFPEIRLFTHKVNRGFSHSVNTGARAAKGDLLVLLNTDLIPSKDFLAPSLVHFANKKVFGVSFSEKGYSWAKAKFDDGFIGHEMGEKTTKTHQTFWISGGSGVFRRDVWMKLGGLDQDLLAPFYWEDLDICYRAAKRGYELLWEPKSRVVHEHEASMAKLSPKYVQRIRERNHLLFIWKNLTSQNLFRKHIAGLMQRAARHPGYFRIIIMALVRFSLVKKRRKKERKESKVSDEAILAKYS